jgi:hypothetical protein
MRRVLVVVVCGCTPAAVEVTSGGVHVPTIVSLMFDDTFADAQLAADGTWSYVAQSPRLPTSASYVEGSYVTPPRPASATAISIGLSLYEVGSITMDAFELVDPGA